ncbi:MAG: hypothetical protein A2204_02685 [Elusimicrobia bacterium RIFOXYA1_FULL_47_7]|nr:MAG: hypothetical protein A2278_08470 [Elusimicrobia bacterium RIFOXYA12_FULL_49_49]OGS06381.1 MAG: hypothetical protein A2204_02685 [Elusimicrobia bacterium RIFOXYA1_FULL_47_7]OGS15901.1 MAG: hypothetical protein A2251_01795 [Elusimicrobia bacterium RIFOXYA2_FULL_47_53]OGS26417.1 MAG: hypothetical protein A2339_03475 [Elusimicrobia bacterium RIFOXYB12_FULL_50_12]OGS29069.1 MAG: hypothetical protein A2323_04335 [Elusimicrobia bacterium RIFOXYB2_FULL_46_23]
MRDFFILKKLNRSHRYAFSFLVKKASALLASVLAPNANFGLKSHFDINYQLILMLNYTRF